MFPKLTAAPVADKMKASFEDHRSRTTFTEVSTRTISSLCVPAKSILILTLQFCQSRLLRENDELKGRIVR